LSKLKNVDKVEGKWVWEAITHRCLKFGQTIYTQIERYILLLFKSATIFKIDAKFTKLQAVKYPFIAKLGFLAVNSDFGGPQNL